MLQLIILNRLSISKEKIRFSIGEEEEMALNVASTQKGHVSTKTEGRTVEKELEEIKHKKEGIDRQVKKSENQKDYVGQESLP
jgi:hypothetical protein